MMNRAIKTKPRPQRLRSGSPWQSLLAPMLLASLGLHGLFLFMPTGVSSEAPIPPPDPEQDSIAITRVPPPGTADPAATPTPAATAPAAGVRPPQPLGSQPSPQSPSRAVAPVQRTAPRSRQLAPQPRSQRPAQSTSPSANPSPSPAPTASAEATAPPAPPATATSPVSSASASEPLFSAEVGERLLAYVAALDLPPGQVERAAESIENRFAFDATAVTRETFNANQSAWESEIRQGTGLSELTPEVNRTEFTTVYPQRVCLSDVPGDINIGALVNPDGSWRAEPTLLRSSGYGALDRKALQEIQDHTFSPAEGVKAYVLTVETSVDYGPRPCLDPNPEE